MKNGRMLSKTHFRKEYSTLFTVERLMYQLTFATGFLNEIMKNICVKINSSGERELFAYHEYGKTSS